MAQKSASKSSITSLLQVRLFQLRTIEVQLELISQ